MILFRLLFVVALFEVVSAVPSLPLAETAFAAYNADWDSEKFLLGGREGDDFCFVSHGCWGGKPRQKPEQRKVSDLISQLIDARSSLPGEKIRFVVAAGDNFYTKGVKDRFDPRFFTTFEQFYSAETPARRIPWLVALGNHDYMGNIMAQVNYTHTSLRESMTYGLRWGKLDPNVAVTGRWYMPHPYYALKVSHDVVVVVIDTVLLHRCAHQGDSSSPCWDGGRQKKEVEHWLLRKFAEVKHKIVVGHYPIMSNGPHLNYKWLKDWLVPLMRKSCAELYINADNHYLQVSQDGYQYYANSGGGAGLVLHFAKEKESWIHPQNVFHQVSYGIMLHCKRGERFTHTVLNEKGEELFHFETWAGEKGAQARQQCLKELRHDENLPDRQSNYIPPDATSLQWSLETWMLLFLGVGFCAALIFRRRKGYGVRMRRR